MAAEIGHDMQKMFQQAGFTVEQLIQSLSTGKMIFKGVEQKAIWSIGSMLDKNKKEMDEVTKKQWVEDFTKGGAFLEISRSLRAKQTQSMTVNSSFTNSTKTSGMPIVTTYQQNVERSQQEKIENITEAQFFNGYLHKVSLRLEPLPLPSVDAAAGAEVGSGKPKA